MDNIELENRIKEIIREENYFEMVMKAMAFEPEYKKSNFYKVTKKSLAEVIKEYKLYYALQLKDLGKYAQEIINNLSLEKITEILDQAGDLFSKENKDIKESLEIIKDLEN